MEPLFAVLRHVPKNRIAAMRHIHMPFPVTDEELLIIPRALLLSARKAATLFAEPSLTVRA